ncbi:tyrosine-protein phosphatase [Granulicella arctica]|uniref:tyrosine-protein phosphatase n=1 Tax=Granulicella arctica TaxID=940613 RepID=UPI0021DFB457|nr:CpsB/CapC family capsule biosynthesis tyrosine phosphatase [Granulicella arctica]
MIDLHHHLLPGLDDGSKTMENSVAMAKLAAADGITHVVCTPHANGKYVYDPAVNEALVVEFRDLLAADNVPLTLGLGCDFHLSYDNIQDAKDNPARYTINNLSYLLVEIPDYGLPRGLTEIFYELQLAGMTPILTHPERNPTLQSDMSRLEEWLRGGVLIQVTGDSVRGSMGKAAEKMAHQLLTDRWVHFLATDAHNVTSRPPRLSEAHRIVSKKYGADYADMLCTTNPRAVFEGKPMPQQEEPRNLYDEREEKGFFSRMFSKLTEK